MLFTLSAPSCVTQTLRVLEARMICVHAMTMVSESPLCNRAE